MAASFDYSKMNASRHDQCPSPDDCRFIRDFDLPVAPELEPVTTDRTFGAGVESPTISAAYAREFLTGLTLGARIGYRSETDYTPAYYDKTFDLQELRSVDLVTSYWTGPAIAHVFVSFGFTGDDYLAISIEVRKPKGEGYSTLKGFFRQYELVYIVADERDLIRLRTNYRHDPPEDVYIYRVNASIDVERRLFLEYMHKMNELRAHPEFYNTLTTNCTTNIWTNNHVNEGRVPLSWKILASGYVPEYLYEQGRLETMGLSFPELQERSHVNARAQAAGGAADFSRRIRASGEAGSGDGKEIPRSH